jgi:hypothetical protein
MPTFISMSLEEFQKSLAGSQSPASLSPYLEALWYDGKDDWETAHTLIQDTGDKTAARIHAYLHRKEGDIANARYWYRNAGQKLPDLSLADEWKKIVSDLL